MTIKKSPCTAAFFLFFMLGPLVVEGSNSEKVALELGESFYLPQVKNKIWIEDSKVLKAKQNSRGIEITTLSLGPSDIRTDNKLMSVSVLPVGAKRAFLKWKDLSLFFANIYPETCTPGPCLSGSIQSFREFEKLMALMEHEESPVPLALEVSTSLQEKIEKWYQEHFKKMGYTPNKIQFARPWTLMTSAGEKNAKLKLEAERKGLVVIADKTKVDRLENIRVEIKVVEIKKELVRKLGIKWPDSYASQAIDFPASTKLGSSPIDLILNANERSGEMKLLASPNLMCRSGQEASFFAGGEFPVKVQTEKFGSVSWKAYGINLKIRPRADSSGQISLEIETEVSSIDKSHEIDGLPALHIHKVSSHFDLLRSKTIVLSGLIKSETGESSDGLPYLSQLPVLGRLFSSKDFLENRTELVIFVTPKIMDQK